MYRMTKNEIRSYQKEQRDGLSSNERKNLSLMLCDKLLQSEMYRNCSSLFTYISFRSEVDTHEIIKQALKIGKKVYAPRVEPQGMDFYRIYSLEGLVPSKFGVLEPIPAENNKFNENLADSLNNEAFVNRKTTSDFDYADCELNTDNSQQRFYDKLMLLPGLAFDPEGNRIGYGAGYYDSYFTSHPDIHFCKTALAYDFQVMDSIPSQSFDHKVDLILTPTRRINCCNK
jgi:5-formyltetrahydrofolate cyclo-ligase